MNNMTGVSAKSRSIALVLCLFLGMVGAHCFYVGRKTRGIIYIVTGGFFTIGVIWDLFCIWQGLFKDADGNFLLAN